MAYSYHHDDDMNNVLGDKDALVNFFQNKKKYDFIILTQAWWYMERKIINHCKKNSIPFYIVDHAPIMSVYNDPFDKKSHLYRSNLNGAKAFFAYGKCTEDIMRQRGCRERIVSIGSPRFEHLVRKINVKKSKENLAIIYDTSARMDDLNVINLIKNIQKVSDINFYVKEHSRSKHNYNFIYKKNLNKYINQENEIHLLEKSKFCFYTFPSSTMIVAAMVGVHMVSGYNNHFDDSIKKYSKKYKDIIFEYNNNYLKLEKFLDTKPDYSNFIKYNLEVDKIPAEENIINYILGDFK
jgi:hypothetical protein